MIWDRGHPLPKFSARKVKRRDLLHKILANLFDPTFLQSIIPCPYNEDFFFRQIADFENVRSIRTADVFDPLEVVRLFFSGDVNSNIAFLPQRGARHAKEKEVPCGRTFASKIYAEEPCAFRV